MNLQLADELLRRLAAAMRSVQLYSRGHPIVQRNFQSLSTSIEQVHALAPYSGRGRCTTRNTAERRICNLTIPVSEKVIAELQFYGKYLDDPSFSEFVKNSELQIKAYLVGSEHGSPKENNK